MKLTTLALILASTICITAQIKKPQPPPVKIPFAESLQALVVTTKDWNATSGTARAFERRSLRSEWTAVGDEFPIVVGRSGLAWAQDSAPEKAAQFKKEGDGKSPAGLFPLTFAFGSAIRPELLTLPYTRIEEFVECVDDANSTHYNKVLGRMQVGNFDWKSSEKMWEIKPEYDLGVFVAYNSYPVVKGNGSCIFLHIWKEPTGSTSGCTAMERRNMERVVSWLDEKKNPYLVQLTDDEYNKLKKGWNLPKLK
jgi:L,D-peptidoglycan transpeptidase YkuD (ErfK/YbiS/YcfS/YnhG family)